MATNPKDLTPIRMAQTWADRASGVRRCCVCGADADADECAHDTTECDECGRRLLTDEMRRHPETEERVCVGCFTIWSRTQAAEDY